MNYIIRDVLDGDPIYYVRRTNSEGKYEYFTVNGWWHPKLSSDCLFESVARLVDITEQRGLPYVFHIQNNMTAAGMTYSCVKFVEGSTEWLFCEDGKYKFGPLKYSVRAKLESKNEVRNIVKEITEAENGTR